MDNLFPLIIVIIVIVGSIGSAAKKEKEQKAAEERRRAASPVKPRAAAQKPASSNAAPSPVMPPMAFGDIPGQAVAPTVHPHLQPDCPTHDASGSLRYVSTEGKDPCHEDQLTRVYSPEATEQAEGGLTFDWSGENMVKAFVMQEVLNRPADRLQQRRAR